MRCKNCGTENPDGSRFCATCGKPLEQEEPAKNVAEQKEEAVQNADQYSDIIILEEHQKSCGVGSAIIEQINDLYAYGKLSVYPKIKRIAIQDKFYSISGSQDYLRKIAGLILS